jgi:hypothetical protein
MADATFNVVLAVVNGDTSTVEVRRGEKLESFLAGNLPEGVDKTRCDVRLNNKVVRGNPALKANDFVVVTPKIVGG